LFPDTVEWFKRVCNVGDFKVINKEIGGDTPTGTVSGSIIFLP
jgi:hypothetical protein